MKNTVDAKKRGRHKKEIIEIVEQPTENIQLVLDDSSNISSEKILKKRGRKPKGGKLVVKQMEPVFESQKSVNVILHLKCSTNDLENYNTEKNKLLKNPLNYDPTVPPEIMTYNDDDSFFIYKNGELDNHEKSEIIVNDKSINFAYSTNQSKSLSNLICKKCNTPLENNENTDILNFEEEDTINIKDINTKLKQLKLNLYKNLLHDKKSACFWCSYDFDNHPCYIPKYEVDEKIYGYGSFCRPECAVAYLMKENIDDSQKFERYHLLNQIYSKIYNFKKSIKPAPNPYYLLDKFYGNLSIQEYRKLLKTEHMLLVIEKPMTRILPELHEDNESMLLNIYGTANHTQTNNNGGVYKVKKQSEKQQGPTKTSIMKNKFGIS